MGANVKKREWVKTAAIIFLAVLLVLTFFSNTILNASLPEVAAQTVTNGTINAKIRGSGTIAANETYNVTISQTRKIASVKVKTGQEVAAGDVLFVLEATESEEVKAAQEALTSAERAYEQALLTASTSDAQENREIEKAREAYNEALAIYRQYSTMDPSNLALAKAEADAELKELQRESADVQKDLTKAQSDKDYTEAQAKVAELEPQVEELQKTYEDLSEQVRNYNAQHETQYYDRDYYLAQKAQKESEKDQKIYEWDAARDQLNADNKTYEQFYNLLVSISTIGGAFDESVADSYANDPDSLGVYLLNNHYYDDLDVAKENAKAISKAYKTIKADQDTVEELNVEIDQLREELASIDKILDQLNNGANNGQIMDITLEELKVKLSEAKRAYDKAYNEYAPYQNTVERQERVIEQLEDRVESLSDEVDDKQEEVDKLANAASAGDTVKSTKQALEDLIFNQSLGDSASLDLKNQREDIEKQKEKIEELTKNADEAEVTAKVPGIINEINVSAGTTVGAEEPLCTINVADRGYTIRIPVTQEQARRVNVGEQAELVNYWGGDVTATLESIANNPETRGGKMLVFRLDGEVDPGTTLTLSIGQKSASYDALVPNSAIRTDNNGSFVLVLVAKSTPLSTRYTATRVDVQELAKDDNYTAVSGISAGEFVITTSTKPIEAGTQVRLVDEQ